MSWFSNAVSWVGNTAKSVISTVAKVALPVVSSLVGAIPVIGGVGSKIVDALGNKSIEAFDSIGGGQDVAAQYVEAAAANNSDATLSRPLVDASASTVPPSAKGFLGIGDGKPGVLGIGTGKNKARKAAEAAALASGASPAAAAAAGDAAAAAVSETGSVNTSSSGGLVAAAIGAALLLLL